MSTELSAHRRIDTYLDDLARMLAGADQALRAEVLGGVREHVEAALGGRDVTEAEVAAVLAELGPPEVVASAAVEVEGASPPGWSAQQPGPGAQARPVLERGWVPPTVGLLLLATTGLYLLAMAGMSVFLVATDVPPQSAGDPASGGFHAPRVEDLTPAPLLPVAYDVAWWTVAPLLVCGLPWLVSTVLLSASGLWTRREKWLGASLLPVVVAVTAVASAVAVTLAASSAVSGIALLASLGLATLATVVVVTRLWRAGARRARERVAAGP